MAVSSSVHRRILLVDDTPEVAELLAYALRDRGYEVAISGYRVSVNELIEQHRAEALVLDCSTFEMSASLFDVVRDCPDHAELPVVVVSDTPAEADAGLQARHADRVLLIPKPFTGSQIARALDELLAVRAAPGS